MANDIHPTGIHGGNQYGTTIMNSNPAISYPKKQTIPGYGKRIKAAAPHGGDQYGTTLHDSKPFRAFPNANIPLKSGSVPQKGSAMKVDSEKVVVSSYKTGINVKNFNGATKKTASQSGSGGPTDRPYPLAKSYPLKSGGVSNMKPNQFQDN
jgi:hypothetical protein